MYIPIEKSLGPVTVDTLHLGFSGGDGTSAFLAAITGGVSIPPLDVLLVDVGFEVVLDPEQDTGLVVGGLGLSVRFKPPLGVGLELDIGDAVEGGGFVDHEPEIGRYTARSVSIRGVRPRRDLRDRHAAAGRAELGALREHLRDVPEPPARLRLLPLGRRWARLHQPHDGRRGDRRRAEERRGRRDPLPGRPARRRRADHLAARRLVPARRGQLRLRHRRDDHLGDAEGDRHGPARRHGLVPGPRHRRARQRQSLLPEATRRCSSCTWTRSG